MWNGRWDRVGSHVGCQCDGIEGGVDGPPEIKGNRRGFRTGQTPPGSFLLFHLSLSFRGGKEYDGELVLDGAVDSLSVIIA